MTFIDELPSHLFLKKILKYAGPVLIDIESAIADISSNAKWLNVLKTTRTMIAHYTILDYQPDYVFKLKMIAINIRNLYRLFGMDLSDKNEWNNICDEMMCYVEPDQDGRSQVIDTIYNMKYISFNEVNDEFIQDNDGTKKIFGHIIYKLVGTEDGLWKTNMSSYRSLD